MGTFSDPKDQLVFDGSSKGSNGHAHMSDMELGEEWQDEEFPRPLPEFSQSPEEADVSTADSAKPGPPCSLALSGQVRKKRLVAPVLSLTLDRTDSVMSDEFAAAAVSPTPDEDVELDLNIDALDTPSDSESCNFPDSAHDLEWEDDLPRMGHAESGSAGTSMMEPSELDQVDSKGRRWRKLRIGGQESQVNMSVLEPYLQVLSHGGYYGEGMTAIIVFSSCYLPENTIENYHYVMNNLFRFIVGTLELMVSENYVMVYLCGAASRNKMPPIKWLRECYMTVDRRLRKDLKGLFVVHPTWYIKALITVVKPFLSVKFGRKLRFVASLQDLGQFIPMEHVQVPECVTQFDQSLER